MLPISGFCRVSSSLDRNKAVKKLELEVKNCNQRGNLHSRSQVDSHGAYAILIEIPVCKLSSWKGGVRNTKKSINKFNF